jgi:8-oxo-dGTP diphosphatase
MRAGAFGVIFDADRRVLLCHRRDMDAWNLPGGRVESGETPWDAAAREVREEVGLETEIVRLTGLYWKPDTNELVFNFECRIIGGALGPSDESDAAAYYAFGDLPPNTAPKQVERIADALANQAEPALRVQRGPRIRDVAAGPL